MTDYEFPYPKQDTFEVLSAQLLTRVYAASDPAQIHGRSGQKQHGIDMTVRSADGRFIGGQSKRYVATALTKAKLAKEIAAAHAVEPKLDALIILTTTRRDARLKAYADQALLHGRYAVFIWFWEDFVDRCREHGMLSDLLVPYPAGYHLDALAKQGVQVRVLTAAASIEPPAAGASPLQQEMSALITQGRASEVVARLEGMEPLDDDLQLTLARAYYQRGEDAKALALGEGTASARLLGLVGLIRARRGDPAGARAAAVRARAAATPGELPYVVALEIAGELVGTPTPAYETLMAMVPPTLADTPAIRGVLGDAALAHDRFELAIEQYEFAEIKDPHPSLARRLALLAARLGWVGASLPSGDLALRDASARTEVARVRDALASEQQLGLDTKFRKAVLHNLGIAASLLGDGAAAVDYAAQALQVAPSDASLWRRWLYVLAVYEQPLDRELALRAPATDPSIQLMLADLEDRAGDRAGARLRVDQALALPELTPGLRTRLEGQRVVLAGPPGPLDLERAQALLALAKILPEPAAGVVRLVPFLSEPALEPVVEPFFAWFETSDLAGLDEDDQLALAALLVGRGFPDRLERMLDLLRRRMHSAGRIDPTVAPVLLDVLIARGRLDEALKVSRSWCDAWPGSARARHVRTSVLIARGEVDQAYQELEAHAPVTSSSPVLIQQYVQLARALGHARKARRTLRQWTLPPARSTRDLQSLYFALAATRDPRLETLALESLQPGAGLDEIAGPLLGMTIRHLRARQSESVRATSVVTLRRTTGAELTYWMGETPSPVQGAAPADWLGPLLNRRVSDQVTLEGGPFAGETVTVIAIKQPIALLVDQAKQLGQATGALEEMQGSPDELIAQMRRHLEAQDQATRRRFEMAAAHPLPAVAMASVFNRSPRDFSQKSEHWTPKCHSGTTPDLEVEDRAVLEVAQWVLDPLTICLIVEAELEGLIAAQSRRPWVTAETRKVLLDWYLQERESVRAHGTMRMREDQRIELHEISAAERRAHRAYWRRVERFVEELGEPAPRPPDEVAMRFAGHEDALDAGTVSVLVAAAARDDVGVLSDELVVRAIAAADGLRSASLRGLAARALHEGRLAPLVVTRMFVRLAATGRTFLALPLRTFHLALQLPSHERRAALATLLKTTRTADPTTVWPAALVLMLANGMRRSHNRRLGIKPRKLLRLVLQNLPLLQPAHRLALIHILSEPVDTRTGQLYRWAGRRHRPLRRALLRWLHREID